MNHVLLWESITEREAPLLKVNELERSLLPTFKVMYTSMMFSSHSGSNPSGSLPHIPGVWHRNI